MANKFFRMKPFKYKNVQVRIFCFASNEMNLLSPVILWLATSLFFSWVYKLYQSSKTLEKEALEEGENFIKNRKRWRSGNLVIFPQYV